MARTTMKIERELRPCIICGKEKALFHTWEQFSKVTVTAPYSLKGCLPGGQVSGMVGLCEFENGEIKPIPPEQIKFIDNKHAEYDFTYVRRHK